MERRAPAQWFVTRPVSLRSHKTGTTQIPFLLVLYLFIALVCSTTVSLVYMSVHYRVVRNTSVCRAIHALGRAAPILGAPQSLGLAAPRFCWFSKVRSLGCSLNLYSIPGVHLTQWCPSTQNTSWFRESQNTTDSRQQTRVVYIAGDTLCHQPMGAGHMTVF